MACVKTIIFTLLLHLQYGQSIRCIDCSSANNSMCVEPTHYDEETLAKYLASVECSQGIVGPVGYDFFCRKIVQTILHKGHDPEVRVTRGCGWVRYERRDCYTADNEDHLETVCQCFTDNCNLAPPRAAVSWATAGATAAAILRLLTQM